MNFLGLLRFLISSCLVLFWLKGVYGGDIVHEDNKAPKKPGCENNFVLVKVPTWVDGFEDIEYVGVSARYGPTLESKKKHANQMRLAIADPPDCCSRPKNRLTGEAILVYRGNCSFTTKTNIAEDAGASAILIVNSSTELFKMVCEDDADTEIYIPAVVLPIDAGNTLEALLHNNSKVSVQLYTPRRPTVDVAEVFLRLMAVGTILCASFFSAWNAREAAIELEKLLKDASDDCAITTETGSSGFMDISTRSAVLFVVVASCFLAMLYKLMSLWFIDVLVVLFCIVVAERSYDWSEISRWSGAQGSDVSPGSSSYVSKESTDPLDLRTGAYCEQMQHHAYSPPPVALAKSAERLYVEEMRKRTELEVELEKMKSNRERLMEELQVALSQNSELESRVANYDHVVKDLEEGMISNVELLEIYEKERDDLKVERDNFLKTAEELLNQSAEASSKTSEPKYFITMSFEEIKEATNDFDPSFQLWEGENGSIYKGVISHSPVTIRMWHPNGLQGPEEFHKEVEILSKFRHPNLVTLIGVCPDAWSLVYEYLPNGNLKERLICKDDTPPLSWQTRIKIATDICSTLIFLHSRMPQRVVHGALKPSSILLDSNFTCKISSFEVSHLIPCNENSLHTELTHGSEYTDPEFFVTGEVNPAVDVYSFGMIILELLTGKPAYGVTDELEDALEQNNFDSLLDTSAGEWPFVQAKQLAKLALRCCYENGSNRPDLEGEIWRVLEPMRASFGGSQCHNIINDENREAPSYFICPIFQEVMKDPHVAADGYTYEEEAMRGWLDTGHDTSPMTNLQLENVNLVPNHALRSAIQEWLQQH